MMRVLIDTNVCMDLVKKGRPNADDAIELFGLCEDKSIQGVVASHAFATIFYLIEKDQGNQKARRTLQLFHRLVDVGTVSDQIICQAIEADWKDFEDAVHYYCALREGCEMVVTNNGRDFEETFLPILTAAEFLMKFHT